MIIVIGPSCLIYAISYTCLSFSFCPSTDVHMYFIIYLFVCLSIYLYHSLSSYIFLSLSIDPPIYLSISLLIYLSTRMSFSPSLFIPLFIYPPIYLSIFDTLRLTDSLLCIHVSNSAFYFFPLLALSLSYCVFFLPFPPFR